ncbi:MAG: hypothetical protein M1820_004161 [Bogoriella megaspora]|nr:MAG: hypothetical protein M1820_004161 [Bogoriella megaspora]
MELQLLDPAGECYGLANGNHEQPGKTHIMQTDKGIVLTREYGVPQEYFQKNTVLANIYVCPGSTWLQPVRATCGIYPPALEGLSELEQAWYACAVTHKVPFREKIYLRPQDRFDVGEGTPIFTLELTSRPNVEVRSSIPEGVMSKAGDGSHTSNGNGTDHDTSFVSASVGAPSRATLDSVQETPHVETRFRNINEEDRQSTASEMSVAGEHDGTITQDPPELVNEGGTTATQTDQDAMLVTALSAQESAGSESGNGLAAPPKTPTKDEAMDIDSEFAVPLESEEELPHPKVLVKKLSLPTKRTPEAKLESTSKRSKITDNGSTEDSASSIYITPADKSSTIVGAESTPSASIRSRNSDVSTQALRYEGTPPKVVFSSNSKFLNDTNFKNFLRRQGGSVGQSMTEKCDLLCIGRGEVRKSVSLLMAIALGKPIVDDNWGTKSVKAGYLLEPTDFTPSDPPREKDWGFNMADAVGKPRNELFANKTIYFTPALKKEYGPSGCKEMEDILKACGAPSGILTCPGKDLEDDDSVIPLVVADRKDTDATFLHNAGRACYHKNLISISVLRGTLDLESEEFRVVQASAQKKTGRPTRSS